MGGTTAAPWLMPYPTGTDRVADGDNAIQSLAERVHALATTALDPWQAIALGANIANIAPPGYPAPGSRLLPGAMVATRGIISGPQPIVVGSLLGTLVAAHRPTFNHRVTCQMATSGNGNGIGVLTVFTDGTIKAEVIPAAGNNLAVTLTLVFPLL